MNHEATHRLAGQTVTVKPVKDHQALVDGAELLVEDYWDRVYGESWMQSVGNIAALNYAIRGVNELPFDDNVVYGKIGNLGYLVHESEIVEETS